MKRPSLRPYPAPRPGPAEPRSRPAASCARARISPGFSAVAIASLALGLGANIAIVSLLNNVLYSTLPVRAPHELVLFTDPARGGVAAGMETGERTLPTYAEFRELQAAGLRSVSGLVATGSRLLRTPACIDGGDPGESGSTR